MNFEKPIFIVGCTNSGTKCLFFSLMTHPDLGGPTTELHWFGIQPNIDGRINRLFALWPCFHTNYLENENEPLSYGTGPLERKHIEEMLQIIEERFPDKFKAGKRWLAKDPKLSLRIKWLKRLWPDATIIAIVRNPWAVVEGLKRKLAILGDVPLNLDTPTAMAQWISVNSVILNDSEKVEDCYIVRYEDMIQAKKFPDGLNSNCFWGRLLGHCKLELKEFKIPNKSKYSVFDSNKDNDSLDRLSEWDIEYINRSGAGLIQRFGYEVKNGGK